MRRTATVSALAIAGVLVLAASVQAAKIDGSSGNDTLAGTNGADVIHGKAGADKLHGNGGGDQLFGGPGNDSIFGDAGGDRAYGGPGNDPINARDGAQDLIDCGDGVDTVIVDSKEDGVFNCENVVFPKGDSGA